MAVESSSYYLLKMMNALKLILCFILPVVTSLADVEVTVLSTRETGGKATVSISLANTFKQPVREARVWVFLLDSEGKVMANKAQWLVGSAETPKTWAAGESQPCAVTVDVPRPVASTRVTFSRLTLADGTEVDPQKQVKSVATSP
jgi:hypothetical protein